MHADMILPILMLIASMAFTVLIAAFLVWAIVYFGRKVQRRATRQHLYVPVSAQVNRIWPHRDAATLYVEYDFAGATIVNRFVATRNAARLATERGQIEIRVDPEFPKDVVVDPDFEKQSVSNAQESNSPSKSAIPSWNARIRIVCLCIAVALSAVLALWLAFADDETIDQPLFWTLVVSAVSMYAITSLLHFLDSKRYLENKRRDRQDPIALEGENGEGLKE